MEQVIAGSPFQFNYPAASLDNSLFVRATIFDISDGSATQVDTVDLDFTAIGTYSGSFTPDPGKTYLVVALVYTDGTYATVDDNYAPWANIYKTQDAPLLFYAFNYGAYDLDESLFIATSIYSLAGFVTKVELAHVLGGVYFGTFTGVLNTAYAAITGVYTDNTYTVIDENRSPAADSFQQFAPLELPVVQSCKLVARPTDPDTRGPQILKVTQGESASLQLIAVFGNGVPFDLTGATLTTSVRGVNGFPIEFGNSKHIVNPDQLAYRGQFTLNLDEADTAAIPPDPNKEMILKVEKAGATLYFRGPSLLSVYYPVPVQ